MSKCWLNNKNIVITGASSGIGRALAEKLIRENDCHIIGVGRNEEKMLTFKSSLGELQDHFDYQLFDVSSEENWRDFATYLKDKNIDILINNAGMLPPFSSFDNLIKFEKEKHKVDKNNINICESIHNIMNTNFMSIVYSCTYLMPIIEKSASPAIINVSSSAGLCPLAGISMYSASKGAVKNFTECLALEKKYYVGLVCPGFTKTDIFRNQRNSSDSRLINLISTDLDKMVKKIYKGVCKKKKRMVLGFDAKLMDKLYRHFPRLSLKIFNSVLRKAHISLFDDVYENNKK